MARSISVPAKPTTPAKPKGPPPKPAKPRSPADEAAEARARVTSAPLVASPEPIKRGPGRPPKMPPAPSSSPVIVAPAASPLAAPTVAKTGGDSAGPSMADVLDLVKGVVAKMETLEGAIKKTSAKASNVLPIYDLAPVLEAGAAAAHMLAEDDWRHAYHGTEIKLAPIGDNGKGQIKRLAGAPVACALTIPGDDILYERGQDKGPAARDAGMIVALWGKRVDGRYAHMTPLDAEELRTLWID